MVAAMRRGPGRRPMLFPVLAVALRALLGAAGKGAVFEQVAMPLVASNAALKGLGWTPPVRMEEGLASLCASPASEGSRL